MKRVVITNKKPKLLQQADTIKLDSLTAFVPLCYMLSVNDKRPRKPSVRIEKAWRFNNVAALHAGILGCEGCDGCSQSLLIVTPLRCRYGQPLQNSVEAGDVSEQGDDC